MNPRRLLTDADGDRIAQAVHEAEQKTSGEIRILLVGQSLRWAWAIPLAGGFAAAAAGAWIVLHETWGHPSLRESTGAATIAGVGAMAVLASLLWFSPIRRRAVRRRAEREFLRLGIARTREHTGVLILLSLRERRVQILADRSIDERMPPGTWDDRVSEIVDAIHRKRPVDGICDSVRKIGEHLAAHFPRHPDDVNELPDRPEVAP